ncbi:MAG TPA: hypothetical protein VES68_01290 [Candidatus Sulfotelmatobacter sp.]|nr:hypothetical protein [Candidatus Sulfotelmatobacter sp.]
MLQEDELFITIPGSFDKFKPEIDLTIDEFRDLGVTVLAPDKGWLYKSPLKVFTKDDMVNFFRPLPSEIGMRIKEIEDSFLESIRKSDLVYIVNPEGFIGETVSFEIGFALGRGIPIYSQKSILTQDLIMQTMIADIKVLTPQEAATDAKEQKLLKNSVKSL